jgi:hypothetical protein
MHAMVCAQVGLLSSQTRLVRIKNVLTEQQDTVEVPTEETLLQVIQLSLLYSSARAGSTQAAHKFGGPDRPINLGPTEQHSHSRRFVAAQESFGQ